VQNVETSRLVKNPAILSACSACAGDYEDPDRTAPLREDAEELAEDAEDEVEGSESVPATRRVS